MPEAAFRIYPAPKKCEHIVRHGTQTVSTACSVILFLTADVQVLLNNVRRFYPNRMFYTKPAERVLQHRFTVWLPLSAPCFLPIIFMPSSVSKDFCLKNELLIKNRTSAVSWESSNAF